MTFFKNFYFSTFMYEIDLQRSINKTFALKFEVLENSWKLKIWTNKDRCFVTVWQLIQCRRISEFLGHKNFANFSCSLPLNLSTQGKIRLNVFPIKNQWISRFLPNFKTYVSSKFNFHVVRDFLVRLSHGMDKCRNIFRVWKLLTSFWHIFSWFFALQRKMISLVLKETYIMSHFDRNC